MVKARSVALVAAGVAAGLLAFALSGGPAVQAQQAAAGANGRYQISAYGYGLGTGGAGSKSEAGAYILDTQTGEVFVVVGNNAPRSVGSVKFK